MTKQQPAGLELTGLPRPHNDQVNLDNLNNPDRPTNTAGLMHVPAAGNVISDHRV
jgi:hypothetical protein